MAMLKAQRINVIILRGMLTTFYLRALPMVTQIKTRNMNVVRRKFSTQVLIYRGVSAVLFSLVAAGESSSLFKIDLKNIEQVP